MDKRKRNQSDTWEYSAYGTGSTEPPKNNGGLVTFLLILVICLTGLVSALGILNIRLFRELERQALPATASLTLFGEGEAGAAPNLDIAVATTPLEYNHLGIAGETVSPFYRRYYHVPTGLYVTDVYPGSIADILGLQAGDILISINGVSVTQPDALPPQTGSFSSANQLTLVIYRGGEEYTLKLPSGGMESSEK